MIPDVKRRLPLEEHHFKKLIGEHGLGVETIKEAGLYSAKAQTLNKILIRRDITCSGIVIPYNGVDGFNRVRLDISLMLNGGDAKYLSPTGSRKCLYIPRPVMPILSDPKKFLYFTEGEFKSLKLTQEGFPCIGLGGIWAFKSNGALLEDFGQIEFRNREIVIVLDSDANFNFSVLHAGYELALELSKVGAKTRVIALPEIVEEVFNEGGR